MLMPFYQVNVLMAMVTVRARTKSALIYYD
jgi:hypothetical protein